MVKENAEIEKINELIADPADESGNHPVAPTVPWYQQNINLEDAKMFIKTNIASAARSFIAVGFYLKCVRDKELYIEDGYESIWDFAKGEYGISKSTASRYMTMNDKFSENGNSPIIQKEYQAFDKSKLQEMMYLEDEQLQEVTPELTVKDIRNLWPTKEIPYFPLIGQMEFEMDFPEIFPDEAPVLAAGTTGPTEQKQTFDMDISDFLPDDERVATSQLPEPGQEEQKPFRRSCITGKSRYGTCSCCGRDGAQCCGQCGEPCNVRCGWLDDPWEGEPEPLAQAEGFPETFEHFSCDDYAYGWTWSEVVRRYLQELHDSAINLDWSDLPSNIVLDVLGRKYVGKAKVAVIIFYIIDEKGMSPSFEVEVERIRQEYEYWHGRKEEPKQELEPVPAEPQKSEWVNPEEEQVDESYNYAGIKRASDRWNLTLARKFVGDRFQQLISGRTVIPDNDKIIEQFKRYSQLNSGAIAVDAGVEAYATLETVEYYREDEDMGICLYERFSNIVRKQLDEYGQEQKQLIEKEPKQETVIDAEFTEVLPEEEYTPEYFLTEQQIKLNELLKACEIDAPDNVPRKSIERYKTIVVALTAMVSSLEQEEQSDEPDPVVQPELPILKNNDQRAAFVDAYETWPLWIETKETGERYYRYYLPDGTSMIVKVYHAILFDYKATKKPYEDRFREGYGQHEYYLLKDGKFFKDCLTNRSLLIEKLKEIQKKGKG